MQQRQQLIVFIEWRSACQRATDAECAIADAWLRFFHGTGVPPTEAEQRAAAELRAEARRLFRAAMAQVNAASEHAQKIASVPTPWQRLCAQAWQRQIR